MHLDDLVWIADRAVIHARTGLDLVNEFHARNNVAPDGVLAVKEGGIVEADKELAVARVRARRAGHGNGAADVGGLVKLGLQLLAAAAGAVTLGIARLGHKAGDDAVELQAVIKTLTCQFLDAGDMVRGDVGAKLDHDATVFQVKIDGVFRIKRWLGGICGAGHGEYSDKESEKKSFERFEHECTFSWLVHLFILFRVVLGFCLAGKKEMKRKGLFLDRDGVINEDTGYVGTSERFVFRQGIFPLLRHAQDRGYRLVIVTNQSGVARGYYTQQDYEKLTDWMIGVFRGEGIEINLVLSSFACPDLPDNPYGAQSFWRKPNPGMFLEAALRLNLDLAASVMIGDSPRDIEAAKVAGVERSILVAKDDPLPVETLIQDIA